LVKGLSSCSCYQLVIIPRWFMKGDVMPSVRAYVYLSSDRNVYSFFI
jgi:hypothetical protein